MAEQSRSSRPLIAAVRPADPSIALKKMAETPKLTPEQEKALEDTARRRAGQITFYPYDRGQCYEKRDRAVMAFVNIPGACAHYMYSSATNAWEFVQVPHMSTERRCSERLGYRSVEAMREALFEHFESYLAQIGWKEGLVIIDGSEPERELADFDLGDAHRAAMYGVGPIDDPSARSTLSEADREIFLAAAERLKQENKPGIWNIASLAAVLRDWGVRK